MKKRKYKMSCGHIVTVHEWKDEQIFDVHRVVGRRKLFIFGNELDQLNVDLEKEQCPVCDGHVQDRSWIQKCGHVVCENKKDKSHLFSCYNQGVKVKEILIQDTNCLEEILNELYSGWCPICEPEGALVEDH